MMSSHVQIMAELIHEVLAEATRTYENREDQTTHEPPAREVYVADLIRQLQSQLDSGFWRTKIGDLIVAKENYVDDHAGQRLTAGRTYTVDGIEDDGDVVMIVDDTGDHYYHYASEFALEWDQLG